MPLVFLFLWVKSRPLHNMQPTDDLSQRPARAPSVRLTGQLPDSGFSTPQWLVERNGQFIQLTEPLYRILEEADGERTIEQIAQRLTDSTEWAVTGDQVSTMIRSRLAPLGLVLDASAQAAPPTDRPEPLRLKRRTMLLSADAVDRVARVLQFLYAPPVVALVIAATLGTHLWLYFQVGLRESFLTTLYTPGLLPLVVGIMFLAGVCHEFGHAAALRYGGGRARGMGAGLYLIYPALYTDTTDAYRLSRSARVRTDLGGFYFYLIFSLGLVSLYVATGYEFLLIAVVLIDLDILYQCLPFVRLDGYWVMADLTGLPDPFSYVAPFVRSLKPGSSANRLPALKPWVRRIFLTYIVLTLPVLVGLLIAFIIKAPSFFMTTWRAYFVNVEALFTSARALDIAGSVLALMQLALLGLIMLGMAFLFYDLGRKLFLAFGARIRWRRPVAA